MIFSLLRGPDILVVATLLGGMSVTPDMDGEGCIGSLEPALHELFSSVRVPGEEFVYSASNEMFNQLDEYCEETTMHEVRPPMLIMDESGSGKSSLLANWLHRRRRRRLMRVRLAQHQSLCSGMPSDVRASL